MRGWRAALIAGLGISVSGCFTIDQALTFEKDLSGTAGIALQVNLEPIVDFMVALTSSFAGRTAAPTEAELASMRKEMLESTRSKPIDFEQERKQIEGKLPEGVRLLDGSFTDEGSRFSAALRFGFDNASRLSQITLSNQPVAGPLSGGSNPVESPFAGLQVVDEGSTLLVTSPAQSPAGDQQTALGQMPPLDAALQKQLEALLGSLRFSSRITAPFEVIEHNAHRLEGNTLVWVYDFAAFEKMTPEQASQGMRVRYRK